MSTRKLFVLILAAGLIGAALGVWLAVAMVSG